MRAPTTKKAQEIREDEKAARKLRKAFKDGTEIDVGDKKIRLEKAPRYKPKNK